MADCPTMRRSNGRRRSKRIRAALTESPIGRATTMKRSVMRFSTARRFAFRYQAWAMKRISSIAIGFGGKWTAIASAWRRDRKPTPALATVAPAMKRIDRLAADAPPLLRDSCAIRIGTKTP